MCGGENRNSDTCWKPMVLLAGITAKRHFSLQLDSSRPSLMQLGAVHVNNREFCVPLSLLRTGHDRSLGRSAKVCKEKRSNHKLPTSIAILMFSFVHLTLQSHFGLLQRPEGFFYFMTSQFLKKSADPHNTSFIHLTEVHVKALKRNSVEFE